MSLMRAATRELAHGLRVASAEVARWRRLALAIPEPTRRIDALAALERKRGNIHGAALFWTLPDRRSPALLRTLVAWEVLADHLDCVSERTARAGIENGLRLHRPLVDALLPGAASRARHHLRDAGGDGAYVQALVDGCRDSCRSLPAFDAVAPLAGRAARLTEVLPLNHEPDAELRDSLLRRWAASRMPDAPQPWFERTAAASAWLTVLAMLALAGDAGRPAPRGADRETELFLRRRAERTYDVYLHSIAPVGAMLDSYGDLEEDAARRHHSYVGHYPSVDVAVQRIAELIAHARVEAASLTAGSRHVALLDSMIAFYLSKDSVRTPSMRERTATLLDAGGPMARALVPALRAWRIAYRQQGA